MVRLFVILALTAFSLMGCDGPTAPEAPNIAPKARKSNLKAVAPWFVRIESEIGIDFSHETDRKHDHFMPDSMGSGAALFDLDNDGRLDIYILQNAGEESKNTNRLYRQDDQGRFTDVSDTSGLNVAGYGMGVAVGDVNNDGYIDVYVTEYGRSRLFVHNGGGAKPVYRDATAAAGLESRLWGTSTSFVDFDRDGWLDLVVVNYLDYDPARTCRDANGKRGFCSPSAFPGRVTRLYRNAGVLEGEPRFEDVTIRSGLAAQPGPGLGVYCADFDGDSFVDIFVANDGKANRLWMNQRDGSFADEAPLRGIGLNSMGKAEADMGIAIGDADGDGVFDIFVTHLTRETPTLWVQKPRGMFRDHTMASGLGKPEWRGTGFGTVMVDFDHDGDLDLAVANGRVIRGQIPKKIDDDLDPFWHPYAQRDQLFANDGKGRFQDISTSNDALCGVATVSRGMATGDIDNDGDMDLLVTTIGGRVRLLRNVAPKRGHWLMVVAKDPALRRDAYGAEVMVIASGRKRVQLVNPGYSYLCSNDPRVHFGLGETKQVDAIEVAWPDGTRERFPGCAVDQQIELRKGEGQAIPKAE